MNSFKYETSKQLKDRVQFEKFFTGYVEAPPSQEARKEHDISVRKPSLYLKKAALHHLSNQPRPATRSLPPLLEDLLSAQEPDGKWLWTNEFQQLFRRFLPDPPDGISDWRWATAIALVVIRRHPEQHETTENAHDKGKRHVADSVLAIASSKLPPERCSYPLNLELVKQGKWRECESYALQQGIVGTEDFDIRAESFSTPSDTVLTSFVGDNDADQREMLIATEPLETLEALTVSLNHVEDLTPSSMTLNRRRNHTTPSGKKMKKGSKQLHIRGTETAGTLAHDLFDALEGEDFAFQVGELVETCLYCPSRLEQPKLSSSWYPAEILKLHIAKMADIRVLHGVQAKLGKVSMRHIRHTQENLQRLKQAKFKNLKSRWALNIPMEEAATNTKGSTNCVHPVVPSPGSSQFRESKTNLGTSLPTAQTCPPQNILGDAQSQKIITCITAYEQALLTAKKELKKGELLSQNAASMDKKYHAFDSFTIQIVQVVNYTVDLVEAVQEWRDATNSPQTFFLWGGKNILLQVINHLDFLGKSKSLAAWYGSDFPFQRNPFMRPTSLDERAVSPRKEITRRVLIDNQYIDQIVPAWKEEQARQAELVKVMEAKQQKQALWWPSTLYTTRLNVRLRAAEKVLLEAEDVAHNIQPSAS